MCEGERPQANPCLSQQRYGTWSRLHAAGIAYLSVWISAAALLLLGYRTACSARARRLPQFSELRVFASLYCFITGIFFFMLMTGG